MLDLGGNRSSYPHYRPQTVRGKINVMQHVAIMRKSWGLLPKILSGEKTIESRWYRTKYNPWDAIKKGDWVYFKNSGGPIELKAQVIRVLQFSELVPEKVFDLLRKYGKRDGIQKTDIQHYYRIFRDKKYCLLIFLGHPQSVKPFHIDKTGFGAMAAWITTKNIEKLRVS